MRVFSGAGVPLLFRSLVPASFKGSVYGVTEGLYHRGSLSGLWFKLSFVLCAFRFLRQQKLIYL